MIQSLLPSPGAALGACPAASLDALLQLAANPAQTQDFAALLSQIAVPAVVSEGLTAVPAELPASMAEPAPTAEFTAQPGNPLPLTLPDSAARLPPPGNIPASAEDQPVFDAAQPASLQIQLQAAPPVRPHQTAKSLPAAAHGLAARSSGKTDPLSHELKSAKPEATLRASETAAPVPAEPLVSAEPLRADPQSPLAVQPVLLQPGLVQSIAPAAPAAPTQAAIAPEAMVKTNPRPVPATPDPAPQAVAHAAPQAAFLRAEIAPIAPQPGQPGILPETPKPVLRAPGLLRIEIAASGAGEPAVKALDKLQPVARREPLAQPGSASTLLGLPEAAPQQSAAMPVMPAVGAAARPHDFAALVERLVAAREAVQPQTATLTVAHAEFGPVELRFRHEIGGLAVSLTSADPGFARAAAVAPPVNLPVSAASFVTAETSQFAPARDNTSSAGGSAGGTAGGSARGQQSERRGESAQQSHHSPRGGATRDTARRSGIFA